jgi:hypothetical protein
VAEPALPGDESFEAGTYFKYIQEISPPWLLGPFGAGFQQSQGMMADVALAALVEAVLQRFASRSAPDALARAGDDRGLVRFKNEDAERFRARVRSAWRDAEKAGTKQGLVDALAAGGFTAQVYEAWEVSSDKPASEHFWFWVYLPKPNPYRMLDGTWGSGGLWGDGGAWDDPVGADKEALISTVKKYKPAHAKCGGIVVALAGFTWQDLEERGHTWASFEAASAGHGWPESVVETLQAR